MSGSIDVQTRESAWSEREAAWAARAAEEARERAVEKKWSDRKAVIGRNISYPIIKMSWLDKVAGLANVLKVFTFADVEEGDDRWGVTESEYQSYLARCKAPVGSKAESQIREVAGLAAVTIGSRAYDRYRESIGEDPVPVEKIVVRHLDDYIADECRDEEFAVETMSDCYRGMCDAEVPVLPATVRVWTDRDDDAGQFVVGVDPLSPPEVVEELGSTMNFGDCGVDFVSPVVLPMSAMTNFCTAVSIGAYPMAFEVALPEEATVEWRLQVDLLFERLFGYRSYTYKDMMAQAFMHRSKTGTFFQQNLALIGDMACKVYTARNVYGTRSSPADFARQVERYQSNRNFSRLAWALGLDKLLMVSGCQISDRMMATTMEAVLGVAFSYGGLSALAKFDAGEPFRLSEKYVGLSESLYRVRTIRVVMLGGPEESAVRRTGALEGTLGERVVYIPDSVAVAESEGRYETMFHENGTLYWRFEGNGQEVDG